MRLTPVLASLVLAGGLASFAACGSSDSSSADAMSDSSTPAMTDSGSTTMTSDAMTDARSGSFAGLNGKSVAGTATIEGGKLDLSGYSSDEGPDLHVYLTTGDDEAAVASGKQLGTVASDQAAQEFSLDGIDTSTYSTVVIHCDKAKAVFGAAALA